MGWAHERHGTVEKDGLHAMWYMKCNWSTTIIIAWNASLHVLEFLLVVFVCLKITYAHFEMTDIIDKEPYINKFLAAIGLNVAVGVEQQSKDDQETEIVLEKTYNFIDSNSAPRTEAISCNAKENLIPADFDIDDEVEAPKAVAGHDDDSDETEQSTTEIVLEKTYNFIDSNSAPRTEAISCNAKENLIPADFDIDDEVEAPKAVAGHDDDSDGTEQSTALPLSESENRSDEGISPDHLYFIVRTCGKG